jgi:hypothetical protein
MKPQVGDHPQCCDDGRGGVTFTAGEDDKDGEYFEKWMIPLYVGGQCIHVEIKYCPWCGKALALGKLYDNYIRDPEALCQEFVRGVPKGAPFDCSGDGHYLCAECVVWNGERR